MRLLPQARSGVQRLVGEVVANGGSIYRCAVVDSDCATIEACCLFGFGGVWRVRSTVGFGMLVFEFSKMDEGGRSEFSV